ncbi:hypothetical protein [Streptomyces sp. NBC_00859]|uniref:hypothetical protein n=1 Tax=Streptomyces sp. NBC_00859 TaxID=2903682 RepID=UPI0038646E1C|nr:hypothetical protein OG584_25295 [Streptomyces sp. NBC_00859]
MAYEQERPERFDLPERPETPPARAGDRRAGQVPDPTAGVHYPADASGPDGGAPASRAGSGGPASGLRTPDVRGDGFEAAAPGGHGTPHVPDSVAESGADPSADVRGSGYATEDAGRHATGHTGGHARGPADPAVAAAPVGAGLLPAGEREKLEHRLHGAVSGFVDTPREAVEEADRVLDETVTRVTGLLAERVGALRTSWHDAGRESQTEELRLALRTYREVTEHLLKL